MSQKVASLYAEIGARTDGFVKGASTVKSGLAGIVSNAAIATAAIVALEKGFDQTVGVAQEYDQTVFGIMTTTGATADQTSRLVQVLDDAGIQVDVVKKALKEMSKDGTEPSIEDMAKLSDEFLALNTGAERGQFLLDKFGKSGQDMSRAMVLGGDAIRKMSNDMSGGLILTEKNIQASEDYRKRMDELDDSVMGLKVSIGNGLIPVLTDLLSNAKSDAMFQLGEDMGLTSRQAREFARTIKEIGENSDSATVSYTAWAESLRTVVTPLEETTDAIAAQEEALKVASEANMNYLSVVGEVTDRQRDYTSEISDINKERGEVEGDIQKALAQGWWEGSDKIQGYRDKLRELDVKLEETATAQEEAGKRMILSMLEQRLAADGLSEAEMNYLLETGLQWGIYSQTAVNEANKAIAKADELEARFNSLPTYKEMVINVVKTGVGAIAADYFGERTGTGDEKRMHAAGGSFMIPMSYGNEGFMMGNGDTASGGETVTITPRGQSGNNQIAALVSAIPSARDNAKALARELMKMGVGATR